MTAAGSLNEAQALAVAAPSRRRPAVASGRRALHRYIDAVVVVDTLVVLLACAVAVLVRFGTQPEDVHVLGVGVDYWSAAMLIAVAWLAALALYRSRDPRIIAVGSFEYRRIVNATAMVFGVTAIIMFALQVEFARSFFVIALPGGLIVLLLSRWVLRTWMAAQRRRGRFTMTTVVVGPDRDVREVMRRTAVGGSTYRVVAAVLDADGIVDPERPLAVPVEGTIEDTADVALRYAADAVIVAGQPAGGGDVIRDLGWSLERTDADLLIASRLANVAGPRIHIRPAEGLPLVHVEQPAYEGGKHVLKRGLDVALSGAALLLLLPVFAVIAVLIRRDSHGPVFFSQDRIGRNGEHFRMFKFRSMVETAEADLADLLSDSDGNGVLFKMREDPRVTRIGRVLRKYSLDELPQLWNVFVGDMSLVGPRPPLAREVEAYEDHVFRRLYIKPGLTGMWQISGRSDLSWEESVRLDLYYVENWSLAGDLQIMWRTVKVIARPNGAY